MKGILLYRAVWYVGLFKKSLHLRPFWEENIQAGNLSRRSAVGSLVGVVAQT